VTVAASRTDEELAARVALRDSTIRHEAAHLTGFALAGITPTSCSVWQDKHAVRGRTGLPLADIDLADPAQARAVFVGIAAGPAVSEGRLPGWPLTAGEDNTDETHLHELAEKLRLDRSGYQRLEAEVWDLVGSAEFRQLHKRFVTELERKSENLEAVDVKLIVAEERGQQAMQHMQLKADTTVAEELGTFTAIAATYSLDRQGERIRPGAFAATIERWRESGKEIPIHWDHQRAASAVIGSIDPQTMRETDDGLYVEGKLDLEESEVAREAWRSLKRNRIGLSFGYLVVDQREGEDGANELRELDVFEVTLTPSPANADTRVLATKSVVDDIDAFGRAVSAAFDASRTRSPTIIDSGTEAQLKKWEAGVYADTHPVRVKSFEA
jgi:Escherichia/Staphylococcus phage prohead protease